MKAEYVLKACGLSILLIPSPRALSTDCGLAIRYSSDLSTRVLAALSSENLLPDVIYRKDDDSHYSPVWHSDTKLSDS